MVVNVKTLFVMVFYGSCAGKAKPRHRIVEESRSSDCHSEHATRGVCSYGRFAWTGLERRERYTPKEELPVAPERRISSVKQLRKLSLLSRSTYRLL